MNRSHLFALLVGVALGAGVTSAVFLSKQPAPAAPARESAPVPLGSRETPSPTPDTPKAAQVEEPRTGERLVPPATPTSAKVENAPAPAATAPPAPEKPAFDFKTRFAALSKKGIAGYRSKEMQELTDALKAAGTNGLHAVIEQLQDSTSTQDRFLLVALLESIGDPGA